MSETELKIVSLLFVTSQVTNEQDCLSPAHRKQLSSYVYAVQTSNWAVNCPQYHDTLHCLSDSLCQQPALELGVCKA
jgi:hypothetical protein